MCHQPGCRDRSRAVRRKLKTGSAASAADPPRRRTHTERLLVVVDRDRYVCDALCGSIPMITDINMLGVNGGGRWWITRGLRAALEV